MDKDLKKLLQPKTARNKKIYALRLKGKSLDEIGLIYDLTRQRVSRIIQQQKPKDNQYIDKK